MGGAASVTAVAQLSEEEAVDHLLSLYKADKDKIERIIAKAKLKQLDNAPVVDGAGALNPSPPTTKAEAPSTSAESPAEPQPAQPAQPAPQAQPAAAPPAPKDVVTTAADLLAVINAVRTDPKSFIPHMQDRISRFEGKKLKSRSKLQPNIMTIEGPAAVEECIGFLDEATALPPLVLSDGLCHAAQAHLDDIGPKGLATHVGSDNSSMQDRIERHGDWKEVIGENLDFGNKEALDIVLSLLVDDNVASRGHRKNIMNDKFRVVGMAWGPHSKYKYACVIDFAGGFGPKVQRLSKPMKVEDATTLNDEVRSVLDSIPFDDVKDMVVRALADAEPHSVDLDYKPGEVEVRIKNSKGTTVLTGSWTVQHQA